MYYIDDDDPEEDWYILNTALDSLVWLLVISHILHLIAQCMDIILVY
jgi:hypothetical protein